MTWFFELKAIRHGFEFYECLLVLSAFQASSVCRVWPFLDPPLDMLDTECKLARLYRDSVDNEVSLLYTT